MPEDRSDPTVSDPAIVVRGRGVPRPQNIAGVITKKHVADSMPSSVQIYPN